MSLQQTSSLAWYNRTGGALCVSASCLGLSYVVGSRAIFTGSIQQYAITMLLLIVTANRTMAAVRQYKELHRGA